MYGFIVITGCPICLLTSTDYHKSPSVCDCIRQQRLQTTRQQPTARAQNAFIERSSAAIRTICRQLERVPVHAPGLA